MALATAGTQEPARGTDPAPIGGPQGDWPRQQPADQRGLGAYIYYPSRQDDEPAMTAMIMNGTVTESEPDRERPPAPTAAVASCRSRHPSLLCLSAVTPCLAQLKTESLSRFQFSTDFQ